MHHHCCHCPRYGRCPCCGRWLGYPPHYYRHYYRPPWDWYWPRPWDHYVGDPLPCDRPTITSVARSEARRAAQEVLRG